jgi:CrcB protein
VTLLAIALAGALGAVLRHGVDELVPVTGLGFPWPTLLVNLTGSTALAALGVLPAVRRRALLGRVLGAGLLGGWTTLSAYAEQGRRLLAGGEPVTATAYLAGTLACCVLACGLVAALGTRLTTAPDGRS